jgi:elongation factor 1-beta
MFSGNLQTSEGLEALNTYLSDRSYVNGFRPSQTDTYFFETLDSCPSHNFPHVCRWYRHISSFGLERKNFPPQINTTEDKKREVNESLVSLMENNRIDPPQVRIRPGT